MKELECRDDWVWWIMIHQNRNSLAGRTTSLQLDVNHCFSQSQLPIHYNQLIPYHLLSTSANDFKFQHSMNMFMSYSKLPQAQLFGASLCWIIFALPECPLRQTAMDNWAAHSAVLVHSHFKENKCLMGWTAVQVDNLPSNSCNNKPRKYANSAIP
jgi:hypothetical protein